MRTQYLVHAIPGRIRMIFPQLKNITYLQEKVAHQFLLNKISLLCSASLEIKRFTGSVIIYYKSDDIEDPNILVNFLKDIDVPDLGYPGEEDYMEIAVEELRSKFPTLQRHEALLCVTELKDAGLLSNRSLYTFQEFLDSFGKLLIAEGIFGEISLMIIPEAFVVFFILPKIISFFKNLNTAL